MRKTILTISLALMMAFTSLVTSGAEETKVTGSASIGVFNKYIFRGYELSSGSAVIQPALRVSYSGFSASFWGNIDSNETATQSFAPDREDKKSFNETDITLSYTYPIGKLSLTGGYVYYGTKYVTETEEVFATVAYDMLLKPTLSVYRDVTSYPGTYVNLAIAHSIGLGKDISLDLAASAGYFAGDDDCFKTEGGTGKKYSAFHDGMVKAGLSIPVFKNTILQPNVQYWFSLSDDAKRHGYNPSGHLDETVVVGLNLTATF
ncbi:MAG: hypothetical protein C4549_04305 [Deltaproteobacteria bacterium]|jgi:hypothetical protein|nr:MAG: hypothetical protein C4549_04305 [Deltaproteobacteria bacterium]